MDPLSAFSLAGTVLQFIGCGISFVELARKLYQRGADESDSHVQLLKLSNDLKEILPKFCAPQDDNGTERSLSELAAECGRIATRLSTTLENFRLLGKTRRRDSIKVAFQLICKEQGIKALGTQMSSFREQLNLHLLLSIREHGLKSTADQAAILKELKSIHNRSLSDGFEESTVGGISGPILEYVASQTAALPGRKQNVISLRENLISVSRTLGQEEMHRDMLKPLEFRLSHADFALVHKVFLANLAYEGMVDRENRIAAAHESTLQWILQDQQSTNHGLKAVKWSSFPDWLESDDQLYWITGKAGSGKSTLMKYLCIPMKEVSSQSSSRESLSASDDLEENPLTSTAAAGTGDNLALSSSRPAKGLSDATYIAASVESYAKPLRGTRQCRCYPYLSRWAGTSTLVIACFYFWNSGMESQMLLEGLLRTLLHQMIRQCPEIMPDITKQFWEPLCLFNADLPVLDLNELEDMFFEAVAVLSKSSKICLFIDGLDEFRHNHEDLINIVKRLIDHKHVKLCVASRPWNIFEDAFGQHANLRLEDLTFDDITKFVQSKFLADKEFENTEKRYPSFAKQLMGNIVSKASGVFLWVDLVVNSLLAGMKIGDRIQDLQRRLDDLPPDLENLYEKILHSLDPFYLEHAAQYFSLVETADTPLNILQFSFADEESPRSAIDMPTGLLTEEEIQLRIEATRRRINSRCKGFLEMGQGKQNIDGSNAGYDSWRQLTVQYLHATVRDFIKTTKTQEFLRSSTKARFDPSIQLVVAYLMTWKAGCFRQFGSNGSQSTDRVLLAADVVRCLKQAAKVRDFEEHHIVELLTQLKNLLRVDEYALNLYRNISNEFATYGPGDLNSQSVFYHLWAKPGGHKNNTTYHSFQKPPMIRDGIFLSLAVKCNVVTYVRAKSSRGGLAYLLRSSSAVADLWPLLIDALSVNVPEPEMIECLIDLGADPNYRVSGVQSQTPWIIALTKASICESNLDNSKERSVVHEKWKQTLKLLAPKGVDRMAVPESRLTPTSRKILQDIRMEERQQRLSASSGWLSRWTLR